MGQARWPRHGLLASGGGTAPILLLVLLLVIICWLSLPLLWSCPSTYIDYRLGRRQLRNPRRTRASWHPWRSSRHPGALQGECVPERICPGAGWGGAGCGAGSPAPQPTCRAEMAQPHQDCPGHLPHPTSGSGEPPACLSTRLWGPVRVSDPGHGSRFRLSLFPIPYKSVCRRRRGVSQKGWSGGRTVAQAQA